MAPNNLPDNWNSPSPGPSLPPVRHFIPQDRVADNTSDIHRALKDEAERAAAHRQQVQADSEIARARGEQALRFAHWTLVVAGLTLLVALATLIVSVFIN